MKLFKGFLKKKPKKVPTIHDNMVYMASLGIPMEKILKYQENCNTIKGFENKLKD